MKIIKKMIKFLYLLCQELGGLYQNLSTHFQVQISYQANYLWNNNPSDFYKCKEQQWWSLFLIKVELFVSWSTEYHLGFLFFYIHPGCLQMYFWWFLLHQLNTVLLNNVCLDFYIKCIDIKSWSFIVWKQKQ